MCESHWEGVRVIRDVSLLLGGIVIVRDNNCHQGGVKVIM